SLSSFQTFNIHLFTLFFSKSNSHFFPSVCLFESFDILHVFLLLNHTFFKYNPVADNILYVFTLYLNCFVFLNLSKRNDTFPFGLLQRTVFFYPFGFYSRSTLFVFSRYNYKPVFIFFSHLNFLGSSDSCCFRLKFFFFGYFSNLCLFTGFDVCNFTFLLLFLLSQLTI